jgi:hypothetical protein
MHKIALVCECVCARAGWRASAAAAGTAQGSAHSGVDVRLARACVRGRIEEERMWSESESESESDTRDAGTHRPLAVEGEEEETRGGERWGVVGCGGLWWGGVGWGGVG